MGNETNICPVSLEIRKLVHRSFDEPLSECELRVVEETLRSSVPAQRWYVELAMLHADMCSDSEARAMCRDVLDEFSPTEPVASTHDSSVNLGGSSGSLFSSLGSQIRRLLAPQRRQRWSSAPLAASLLVLGLGLGCGVGLLASSMMQTRPAFIPAPWTWKVENDVVAKVVSTSDAIWQPSQSPVTLPSLGLRSGQQIRLESGVMHLSFRAGASLLLQGPVVFEVRSEQGGKLYSGKLSVVAHEDINRFVIEVPDGRFSLGPGQYGIVADDSGASRFADCYAFSGIAPGAITARYESGAGEATEIVAGQALRGIAGGITERIAVVNSTNFIWQTPSRRQAKFQTDTIYLGNLFDDSKSATLSEAMATDTYQAAGETIDLGVAAVQDGGLDMDVSLAEDGVRFNLANIGGGGPRVLGLPGNDTYRSTSAVAIRTTGEDFGREAPIPKHEEGIGMCANELITFDLEEIREAGVLDSAPMVFRTDRAGINDREDPKELSRQMAGVRTVAVVSTTDSVIAGYVNGELVPVVEHAGVYTFDVTNGRAFGNLNYNGKFVSFDVPLPAEARFLTLATVMLGQEHHDHGVFSGARLELAPAPSATEVANIPKQKK